ncbi:hypothetical protein B0O80DRAFT_511836 [Mortierella sp. GBAus27b]|nr:hypothetical protein B0O80DRAFT_511836 [Mortierella sp. GBAus27b]
MSHSPPDSFQNPLYNTQDDDIWLNLDWSAGGSFIEPTIDQGFYDTTTTITTTTHYDNNNSSQIPHDSRSNDEDIHQALNVESEFIDYRYGETEQLVDACYNVEVNAVESLIPVNAQHHPADESDPDNNEDSEDDNEEGWWGDDDEYAEGYETAGDAAWNGKGFRGVLGVDKPNRAMQTTATTATTTAAATTISTISTTEDNTIQDDPSESQEDSLYDPATDVGLPNIVNLNENDFLMMRSVDVYEADVVDDYPAFDVFDNTEYHPDQVEVRRQINALYDELATSESQSSPSSTPMPYSMSSAAIHFGPRPRITNVQELMDRLIREHLPRFWRHRAQDPELNKFNAVEVQNSRPHKYAMYASCVDCGYKFHKQPLYDCSAAERQRHRGYRKVLVKSNVVGKGDRGAWRTRKEIKAVRLYEYRTRMRLADNSFMSQSNVDSVLNNNRCEDDYDGNLDYIGVKEEGHPLECPRNRPPKKSGTKLHFGWEIAVGHDHSSLPVHPNPNSFNGSQNNFGRYYPARSLMAAFAHLLPQGETLAQNKLRKLFTYFVWHPWFDCDLQAMTVRSGYRELWPLFLLRDEDTEVTAVEAEQYRQLQSTSANAQRKKRKATGDVWNNDSSSTSKKAKTKRPHCKKVKREESGVKAEVDDDDDDLCCTDDPRMTPDEIERERLLSLEQRFTTMFNIGLTCHGVVNESRNQSSTERARVHRQVNRGWVLRARPTLRDSIAQEDSGNDGDNEADADDDAKPRVKNVHKIYEYTARRDDNRKSLHPRTRYSGCFPLMKHTALTRPHLANAVELLEGYLPHLFNRAEMRRKRQGFVLPEYMTKGKDSRSVQHKGKARKEFASIQTRSPSPELGLEMSARTSFGHPGIGHGSSVDTHSPIFPPSLYIGQGASVPSFGPVVHSPMNNPHLSGRGATFPSTTFSPSSNMPLYPLSLRSVVAQSQPPHSPLPAPASNPMEFDLRARLLSLGTAVLPQTLFDPNPASILPGSTLLGNEDVSITIGDSSEQTFLRGRSISSSHQLLDISPPALSTIAPSEMHLSPIFDYSQAPSVPAQNPLPTLVVPPSSITSDALFTNALLQPTEVHGLQHQSQISMATSPVLNMNMNETATPSQLDLESQQHTSGVFGVQDRISDDEIRAILEASMGGWTHNAQDKL